MATFTGSDDLQGAKFVDVDLRGARFVGADLSGVVMRGVEVRGIEQPLHPVGQAGAGAEDDGLYMAPVLGTA